MTKSQLMIAALPALALAAPAAAQTAVGVVDPTAAMFSVKAIGPAYQAVSTQYRAAYTTAQQREQALETQVAPLRKRLDTNNDGNIDQAELTAAQNANKPELQQIVTAQQTAQTEIANALRPANLAQAWVLDQVRQKYQPALNSVATSKRLGVILTTDTVAYVTPATDVTDAVTAAIDTTTPTLTTTPPANWQPDQATLTLWQRFTQLLQMQAARSAQQGAPAPAAAGTRPAATPAPAAPRPATPAPARNPEPGR